MENLGPVETMVHCVKDLISRYVRIAAGDARLIMIPGDETVHGECGTECRRRIVHAIEVPVNVRSTEVYDRRSCCRRVVAGGPFSPVHRIAGKHLIHHGLGRNRSR